MDLLIYSSEKVYALGEMYFYLCLFTLLQYFACIIANIVKIKNGI